MCKKFITITFVITMSALFFENCASERKLATITINNRNGYPSNSKHQGGSSRGGGGGGSFRARVSTPWENDKFQKARIGSTDILPGATQVPMGTAFLPNVADLTITALQSLNTGPNSSMMEYGTRHDETTSYNGFVIPSDFQLRNGKLPHFRIDNINNPEAIKYRTEVNNLITQAFNNQALDLHAYWFYAFANFCKERVKN